MPESRHTDGNLLAFGQAVRQMRERRGVGADELAGAAAMPRERIDALEIGQHDPNYDQVLALADAFHMQPSTLVIRAERLREPNDP